MRLLLRRTGENVDVYKPEMISFERYFSNCFGNARHAAARRRPPAFVRRVGLSICLFVFSCHCSSAGTATEHCENQVGPFRARCTPGVVPVLRCTPSALYPNASHPHSRPARAMRWV
jgi:hypothetical protein